MPQLQPFWDPAYSFENPGPYVGETYSSNPWDTAYVKGVQIPGLVSLSVSRSRHMWVIEKPGIAPTPIKVGYEPLRFTMTVKIWTPEQWDALQPIIWFLQPIFDKSSRQTEKQRDAADAAFDAQHPLLSTWSVHSVIGEKLGPMAGEQIKTLTIGFLEYRRGKTAVATVNKSQDTADPFNAKVLQTKSAQPLTGPPTVFTPTQGPQVPPSQSPHL